MLDLISPIVPIVALAMAGMLAAFYSGIRAIACGMAWHLPATEFPEFMRKKVAYWAFCQAILFSLLAAACFFLAGMSLGFMEVGQ